MDEKQLLRKRRAIGVCLLQCFYFCGYCDVGLCSASHCALYKCRAVARVMRTVLPYQVLTVRIGTDWLHRRRYLSLYAQTIGRKINKVFLTRRQIELLRCCTNACLCMRCNHFKHLLIHKPSHMQILLFPFPMQLIFGEPNVMSYFFVFFS